MALLGPFMGVDVSSTPLAGVTLKGRTSGAFKQLPGFRKDRHTIPDAVTAATQAFLARLCEPALQGEAEELFQRTRVALAYKRKDLSVDYAPGQASLTAKDFILEIAYELDPEDPASYAVTRILQRVASPEVVVRAEFNAIFGRMFSNVVFALSRGVSVESVIDAVEGLANPEETAAIQVTYPSDCRECLLSVPGVEAQVRCTGHELSMEFPRPGTPQDLLEAFAAVRHAFSLTSHPVLGGLA